MSNSKEEDSLPPPTSEAIEFEPLLSDPLAAVYFPITSGQLAILAEKKKAQQSGARAPVARASHQSGALQQPEASQQIEPDAELEALQARLDAYIRYFEDHVQGETWQRRTVVVKRAMDADQNNT